MSCGEHPPYTNRVCDLARCCMSSQMKEIVCSHCGAVSVSAADVSVCPHCRSNPRSPPRKIGSIADQNSKSHGPTTVVYRFWTRTGECFEHCGTVVSERKAYSERGLVPVFYAPEDPSKSFALCCTMSRLRIRLKKSRESCKKRARNPSGGRRGLRSAGPCAFRRSGRFCYR